MAALATLRTIIIVLPPLTFRTYQILPHTNSHYHRLYSYLDLLPHGPLGYRPETLSPVEDPKKSRSNTTNSMIKWKNETSTRTIRKRVSQRS